jgi:hypothetical protein
MDQGTLHEYRLKRLYFYMGYLTRRGVTLLPVFGPGAIKIADVDVLAVQFLPGFRPHLLIGECKSGERAGTIDRFLWMRGLRQYLQADEVFVAKTRFSHGTNILAREWDILAIDDSRLEELEEVWVPDPTLWIGSHDHQHFYSKHRGQYDKVVKNDPALKKVFSFARSEFWYTPNPLRLKRTIRHIDDLAASLVGDWNTDDVAYTQRWLLMELIVLLSASTLWLCHQCFPLSRADRASYIRQVLTAGLLPREELEKIRRAAQQYISARVRDVTGQQSLFTAGDDGIAPPAYSEGLLDIVERLLAREKSAIRVPRLLDLVVYQVLLKGGGLPADMLSAALGDDLDMTLKLAKNGVFFLINYTGLTKEHVADLLAWELPT